ncbi:MAG: hypothetical protein WC846_05100 [Candidatus Gracilibacteria bacterium]|jgi:hypothetical protein
MPQKSLKHSITLNNKKYFYILKSKDKSTTFVECEAAKINQPFLNEDIPNLLLDLPKLIFAEKEYQKNREEVIRFRVSAEDRKAIEKVAVGKGFKTMSGFLRHAALGV